MCERQHPPALVISIVLSLLKEAQATLEMYKEDLARSKYELIASSVRKTLEVSIRHLEKAQRSPST